MWTCILCHFATEPDDVVVATPTGRCICLRCYAQETDSERPMPKRLRRALSAALAELEPA